MTSEALRPGTAGTPLDPSGEVLLRARDIHKAYGRVSALRGVSIEVYGGEIVGLVGDNGAGKSTLVKILTGVLTPDAGAVEFLGQIQDFSNAHEARILGIEAVHQHLGLAENLTVYENIFLGRELTWSIGPLKLLNKPAMRREARRTLADLNVDIRDVEREVTELSGGQRQFVSLARALTWESPVVVLDEPTASLSTQAADRVMKALNDMRERGVGLIMVSHDIPHILSSADRIVVLRSGEVAGVMQVDDADPEMVVSLMTGALRYPNSSTMNEGQSGNERVAP